MAGIHQQATANVRTWQQLAHLTDNEQSRAAVWQEAVASLPQNDKHAVLLEQLTELVCAADDKDSERVIDAFQSAFQLSNHPTLVTAFLDYLSSCLLSPATPFSPVTLRSLLSCLPLTVRSSLAVLAGVSSMA